jgi:hypothetical protein
LLYISIWKAASSRVRATLIKLMRPGATIGKKDVHSRRLSGLPGIREVGIVGFHRLATDPQTLRFTFVRNPYDRLVSCWAGGFQDQPLVESHDMIKHYLRVRPEIDARLPAGRDKTLSFPDFVMFATATADRRVDGHWQLQSDIVDVPGINLDLIGKVESFELDFVRVLDHANADASLRAISGQAMNESRRSRCAEYYSSSLAERVYRAYERDFDTFKYPKTLPH